MPIAGPITRQVISLATGASEQQWLPSVNVEGLGNLGTFDKFSGGDASASITMYRPGGMGPEQAFQALPVFSDVTLTRAYIESRDHSLIGQLHPLVGRRMCTMTLQPLDDTGNPWGTPRTYQGRLSGVNDGATDSESNAVRTWTISMKVETIAN